VRTLNALMHALNTLMHALMMHHDARVDARVNARVNAYAMQFACLLNQLNQLNHHCLIQIIIIGSK